jgi:peptidoglycan/LPS O-acetylase OafA/YrhL
MTEGAAAAAEPSAAEATAQSLATEAPTTAPPTTAEPRTTGGPAPDASADGRAPADARATELPDLPAPDKPRHYLRAFDLFRVIAFVGVVAQHSVLWPVPGGSKVGWSLVMVLHATRNVFFFLSALVAVYSQLERPLSVHRLWIRRLGTVMVPYLTWTLIYFLYSIASTSHAAAAPASALWNDLYFGYYQLYFLVVLFQVYVLLPGIVWLVRRTRGHHALVFGASLALQLAMMTMSHYFSFSTGAWHAVRAVDLAVITSRVVIEYQLFVIAGALAADHLGQVHRVLDRNNGRVLWGVLGVFVLVEGYYAVGLLQGNTPGHASDLFQPVATVWFLAACYGLWAIGVRWARRAAVRPPSRFDRVVTWGSDASGGYYLSHVLVLQLIFSGLQSAGLTGRSTWGAAGVVLFVGTLVGAGLLVTLLWRTPLRAVLTGPDRTVQRSSYPVFPPAGEEPSNGAVAMAAATASAIAR